MNNTKPNFNQNFEKITTNSPQQKKKGDKTILVDLDVINEFQSFDTTILFGQKDVFIPNKMLKEIKERKDKENKDNIISVSDTDSLIVEENEISEQMEIEKEEEKFSTEKKTLKDEKEPEEPANQNTSKPKLNSQNNKVNLNHIFSIGEIDKNAVTIVDKDVFFYGKKFYSPYDYLNKESNVIVFYCAKYRHNEHIKKKGDKRLIKTCIIIDNITYHLYCYISIPSTHHYNCIFLRKKCP